MNCMMKFGVLGMTLLVLACSTSALAQLPLESYQRWLMIIKPVAAAGGPYTGTMNQTSIDTVTTAFTETWPAKISNITSGRVRFETHVLVSPCPLTAVHRDYRGMVGPEHIPADVATYVSPGMWDGVAVYSAFEEFAYWGISSAAGVGWFSVSHSDEFSMDGWTLAAWTHEMLHSQAWYFADGRLGKTAPRCHSSPDGSDGTHCGEETGYTEREGGLRDWMKWNEDYLNGEVDMGPRKGLGSKAWKLGTRREAYLKLPPGSLRPSSLRKRDSLPEAPVTAWDEAVVRPPLQDLVRP